MKLLLTGGTGFFGKAILRQCATLHAGDPDAAIDRVTVLTRDPDHFVRQYPEFRQLPWLEFVKGDIQQPASLPKHGGFSHILHAAADSTDPSRLTSLQRYEQITQGTRNLLDLAGSTGVQRFLLTSSGAVYGPQPADLQAMPENFHGMPDPMNTANVYGVAKREAEHLCVLYREQSGVEIVVARCFAFVGEDLPLDVHFAIGNFIRDALFNDAIVVGGDGTPVRSYMYQTELARWLLVMLREGRAGQAYNVGSAEAITIAELAYLIRDLLAPGKPVKILAQAAADKSLRNRYLPDISKAHEDLGLDNCVPLREAILRTVQELRRRHSIS
jgi:UDP-glucuronate decarboxylase